MESIGSGDFEYEVCLNWEKLPSGYVWTDDDAVAVDSKDWVYVLNRAN